MSENRSCDETEAHAFRRWVVSLALRDVVNAQGGLSKLEPQISVSREELHEVFSEHATLQFKTFETVGEILHGLGFKFSIETLENSP